MGNFCRNHDNSTINAIEIGDPKTKPIENMQITKTSEQQISGEFDQSTQRNVKKCAKCQNQITSLIFIKVNCSNNCCFHQICMDEHLKKQIESGKTIIKCGCGTKLNTYFLRQSSIPGKMNLLSRLFQKQLDQILQSTKQIRRDTEVQNYVKENRLSKELQDYFLINQDTLIYDETPQ